MKINPQPMKGKSMPCESKQGGKTLKSPAKGGHSTTGNSKK